MAITQRDIAEKLHISRSLVAGVLNNRADVYASEETRRRIMEAAQEMNYRPHAAARALRSGRTMVVALCVLPGAGPNEVDKGGGGGGLESLIETLARTLSEREYRLQVDISSTWTHAHQVLDELARTRSCDAVVLWGEEQVTETMGRPLEVAGIPFVAKGYYEAHSHWPQIDYDHISMMRLAVEHLRQQGHSRLGYMGHHSFNGKYFEAAYARKLREGFALATADLYHVYNGYVGYEGEALEVMRGWLQLPPHERPTALVLGTNDTGSWNEAEIALCEAGQLAGNNPDQFALCGLHAPRTSLLFGQAFGFDQADFAHLAQTMCDRLLLPILNGTPLQETVVRVLPEMHALPSLELQTYQGILPGLYAG